MRRSCVLVPALSALLLAPAATQAIEVGDLTIGGFVDTWFELTTYDEAAPGLDRDDSGTITAAEEDDDQTMDFAAEVELQFGWSIGSDVHAQIDVEFTEAGGSYLETATVTWDVSDSASIMMGEFVDWLGWEAADAPGRYRINRTPLISEGNFYGTKSVTGVAVLGSPSETMSYGVYLVDHIYGTHSVSDELALGADFTFKIDGYGSVNVELASDTGGAAAFGSTGDGDATGLGVNTTYDAAEGLVVGAELHYIDFDDAGRMGLMVLANKTISDTSSVTGQIAYLDPNDDADDDEVMELTAALLTTPTGDSNFAVNYELSFIDRGDLGAGADRGQVSFYVEFLAIIP